MSIRLELVSRVDLQRLARGDTPEALAVRVASGALPPEFVAQRALDLLDAGVSAHWCSTFFIVYTADDRIVGGCGFKHPPRRGVVEIGYGVSSDHRNQGVATLAVRQLCATAFASVEVHTVLAQVVEGNHASVRVLAKCGFTLCGHIRDDDGLLEQWTLKQPELE